MQFVPTYSWQCIGKVYAWNDINAAFQSWSGSGVLIGTPFSADRSVRSPTATRRLNAVQAYNTGTGNSRLERRAPASGPFAIYRTTRRASVHTTTGATSLTR